MTNYYKNVFINATATTTGPTESNGPLSKYYDKSHKDYYMGAPTFEQGEIKMITENIDILKSKTKNKPTLFISGDLSNQLTASNYAATNILLPYMGIYNACATSVEGLMIASSLIESEHANNIIVNVSSHNNTAEKTFRYPTEYGGPKKLTSTFTTTGSAAALVSNIKEGIKIESATIGLPLDSGIKDVSYMGAVMAYAAVDTIHKHLIETKREIEYYDLILTGDLGLYGKKIFKECLKKEYNYETKNIEDSACLIFDIDNQQVYSGGSGPACLPLVTYSFIFDEMKNNRLKKVLLIATGALMSPATVNQKMSIPAIAHALSLEVIE
ncbi:MAG: stage V sporulation protein AD [Bacilli bacterium]